MYANVALDLPLYEYYTYSIPPHLELSAVPGKRVIVPFGKRVVTGIISHLITSTDLKKVLPIKFITDDEPVINDELLKFCNWVSEYYIAPPGEVLFSCIPRRSVLTSVTRYELCEGHSKILSNSGLRSAIYSKIVNILEQSKLPLSRRQIEGKTGSKNLSAQFKKLEKLEVIKEVQCFEQPIKEKNITILELAIEQDDAMEMLKDQKLRSEKYGDTIRSLATNGNAEKSAVISSTGITAAQIDKLESLGIIRKKTVRTMREHDSAYDEKPSVIVLNEHQTNALDKISGSIIEGRFKQYLLHGITGSGKTEVYIRSALKCLELGKTAIILVPEISLTPQLVHRFKSVFGNKVGTIHSKLSEGERLDTFDRILKGDIKIVIGARSALFAPVQNIGLIVIDEEHDSSYKQESSPRYNGRDAGVYRASINNAVVVLGSATPSMESYHNAVTGKYKLLKLPERVSEGLLPSIKIVDLMDRESVDDDDKIDFLKSMEKTRVKFLSKDLIYEIGRRLESKESVMILQNRRGYYSYLECRNCGNVEMCERCNIALAYHKSFAKMMCHYCGYFRDYSPYCTKCKSHSVTPKGAGTERVEEEISKLYPRAVVVRMDSDSLHSAAKYESILRDFYEGRIDILTGTQIISKGLDFPNVTLVGVINADIGLLNPDFRSTEKTFQILTQVSGRSGRSVKRGDVLIQTNHADYYVFSSVKDHDYEGFYEREIKMREELLYPPFSRIALLELRSKDLKAAADSAKYLFNTLKKYDKKSILKILPPVQPLFSKLRDLHRYHILIKSPKSNDISGNYLTGVLRKLRAEISPKLSRNVQFVIDMDAVNLM